MKDARYEEPSTHGAYEESMTLSLRDLSRIIWYLFQIFELAHEALIGGAQ